MEDESQSAGSDEVEGKHNDVVEETQPADVIHESIEQAWVHKKTIWNMSEILILFDARKNDWLAYGPGIASSRALYLPHNQQWAGIAKKCWEQGIQCSNQQCLDKWEALRFNWQKEWDYERNIPSG
jgi:hypothetical protein